VQGGKSGERSSRADGKTAGVEEEGDAEEDVGGLGEIDLVAGGPMAQKVHDARVDLSGKLDRLVGPEDLRTVGAHGKEAYGGVVHGGEGRSVDEEVSRVHLLEVEL
jgi:hypothetical protein